MHTLPLVCLCMQGIPEAYHWHYSAYTREWHIPLRAYRQSSNGLEHISDEVPICPQIVDHRQQHLRKEGTQAEKKKKPERTVKAEAQEIGSREQERDLLESMDPYEIGCRKRK